MSKKKRITYLHPLDLFLQILILKLQLIIISPLYLNGKFQVPNIFVHVLDLLIQIEDLLVVCVDEFVHLLLEIILLGF